MRKDDTLTSIKDIESISYDILKQSKCFGEYPTPVDKIAEYAELNLDSKRSLEEVPKHYLSRSKGKIKRVLGKVFGLLDRREKVIYVRSDLIESRKNFVKLHEIGHEVLPWQRELYDLFQDSKASLDKDAKEEFEFEANHFASSTLFQLELFSEQLKKLPLSITSAIHLAELFGASYHATFRQYVEHNFKRCALLVLKVEKRNKIKFANYFESIPFTKEFGKLKWPLKFNEHYSFVSDIIARKNLTQNGNFIYTSEENTLLEFQYDFFNNSYNCFVFFRPKGEEIKTKTKVFTATD